MRKQFSAAILSPYTALLIALVLFPGCGGSNSTGAPAGPQSLGDTPPPVLTRNHWHTSFEASEGFVCGDIAGQGGWRLDMTADEDASSAAISDDMAATGNQCLKFEYRNSTDGVWWDNLITIIGPTGALPDAKFDSVTFRMKIYRDPGETEYPQGSGIIHPNISFNQFLYNPRERYMDFGDAPQDSKIHAEMYGSDPRSWGDDGWEQVTGRFVELVIYDNFVTGTRIVWYDGRRVATVAISNPGKSYHEFILGYCAVNPGVPAQLGKPMYIDDIDVNWELGFTQ